MKSITRYFNKVCAEKYGPLGFSKTRTEFDKKQIVFFRISEDVIQSFTLKRFRGVPICTVEFEIDPLCAGAPIYLGVGDELDRFSVEQHAKYGGWKYQPLVEQSVVECVNAMSETMDKYLIPLFDRCVNCAAALPELIKTEELFEKNRIEVLCLEGRIDCATSIGQEDMLFDDRKYYMALKSHDLAYARKYLRFQISYREKKLKKTNNSDSVRERFSCNLNRAREQLKQLESAGFDYFDPLLSKNEDEARKYLAEQYPQIR